MKKVFSILLTGALMFSTLNLVGCTGAKQQEPAKPAVAEKEVEAKPEEAEKSKLIGISVPSATHGWVAATAYYAEKKARELGLEYKLVVSANPNEQASQLEELTSMKCSAIVLFPHNDEVTVAAQKVLDAGIPLINFDRKVDVDSTAYLAGDNAGIGNEGAKYIAEKLGKKGKVVIISVPSWGDINTERVNGFRDTIAKDFPEIEILNEYGANTAAQQDGLKVMADALTANKNIDGIFSVDDELSIGIQKAIEEAKRTDIKAVTGGGGMQAYFNLIKSQESISYASALYSPSMIQDCVQIAKDIIDGKTPEKTKIIPSDVVDRANVDQYLDSNSPY
ncbi:MAG: LacI family transcriptional regulator [Clostridia bacterium]|jgi:ribose transport system substrate-binding protein|nr:LacI family transcriptional regulator [Clostridia bacterium]